MKFVIVFSALFAVTLAASVPSDSAHAEILKYENDNIGVEGYNYNVEQSDGKYVSEHGELRKIDNEHEAVVVKGEFSYVGDDGHTYSVHYIADEHGFQPEGEHLPKSA